MEIIEKFTLREINRQKKLEGENEQLELDIRIK